MSQGREKPGENSEDWLEEPRRECCYKYEREERFVFNVWIIEHYLVEYYEYYIVS